MGHPLPAIACCMSGFFAVPPGWRMLAGLGIHATRKIKAVAVIGTWIIAATIAAATNALPQSPTGVPARKPAAVAAVEGPETCEGIRARPKQFAVLHGAPLHERADAQSEQVSIQIGSEPQPKPVSTDLTMTVREQCRSGNWSYVSILQLPSDIGKARGWVPTASLRPVNTDIDGRRIYGPEDFDWPDGSLRYQKAILTVVNRVMAQNSKCDAFNPQSILMDKDRAGVLIKAACYGEEEQIVEFRPDDATNGRSFMPAAPVVATDERTALAYCQTALRERATHPSTVEIGYGTFVAQSNGTATYRTTFTAKNAFNLTLKFATLCRFLGDELIDIDIQEAVE